MLINGGSQFNQRPTRVAAQRHCSCARMVLGPLADHLVLPTTDYTSHYPDFLIHGVKGRALLDMRFEVTKIAVSFPPRPGQIGQTSQAQGVA